MSTIHNAGDSHTYVCNYPTNTIIFKELTCTIKRSYQPTHILMAQQSQSNGKRIIQPCKLCTGTGTIGSGRKSIICQGCVGRGHLMLIDETPCFGCEGTGYEPIPETAINGRINSPNTICPYCRGNGHQNVLKKPEIRKEECVSASCQACSANEKKRFGPDPVWYGKACNACHSTGSVQVLKGQIPCGFCKNTGLSPDHHDLCYICKGSGWSFSLTPTKINDLIEDPLRPSV